MKTYLQYLFSKLKAAWQEDKWLFFFVAWLVSLFAAPLFLFACSILNLSFGWWVVGFSFAIYDLTGALFFSMPYWRDYLYWTWCIIKLPYTFPVWVFHLVQGSYRSFREWKKGEKKLD